MKNFTSKKLKSLWIKFYEKKGHINIGSASLLPENDPSVLFTTAGMHPLVPFLLGEPHPAGKRLCNIQKCIRTNDIDEVGDICHLTFFEMMGNWSLGDYFKKEMIPLSYEFLTKVLGLDKQRLAFTVFEGNELVSKDEVSFNAWVSCGVSTDRIACLPAEDNWWPNMTAPGPCGPDSEMFYWVDNTTPAPKVFDPKDKRWVEIWNDVFMEFNHKQSGEFEKLKQQNIDTGMGLERTLTMLTGAESVYVTELFAGAIKKIEEFSGKKYNDKGDENTRSFRIVADHVRSATAVLGDVRGVVPSNTDAGYVLRRLIRRAIINAQKLGVPKNKLGEIAKVFIEFFKEDYPEFKQNEEKILSELAKEEDKFRKTLLTGEKEFEKTINGILRHIEFASKKGEKVERKINGKTAFRLYETFGFPLEITKEMAIQAGFLVDEEGFREAFKEHQELARAGSEQHFKGGLADTGEATTKLHTAAHLLQAALRKVLGTHVAQKGSNITSERLRFDFSHDKPMTKAEIAEVEKLVNETINKQIPVVCQEMTLEEAKNMGAFGVFESKYGEKVKVYKVGDFSSEICGGPHAKNTLDLGKFKIVKEQSSSSGVRRIKAVLE